MNCPHCHHILDLTNKCRNPSCYNYEKEKNQIPGLARRDDPDTSHEAAELFEGSGVIMEIYRAMSKYGAAGCISDDVSDDLPHLENQTFTPRFIQMVERGMIEVTGEKRRGHHNGRMQQVRRVLPEPHVPPIRKETGHEKIIRQIRAELNTLGLAVARMSNAEDRARVRWSLQRLNELVKN